MKGEDRMYRVMLADDNKFALEYFSGLVNWKSFGFTLVNTSIDGIEAWKNFCRFRPQVVIADVEMPGMDGIELAGKIREQSPETVILFLSSYDEFDYARAAIDLSVQDYILKQELDGPALEKKLRDIFRILKEREEKQEKLFVSYLKSCFQMPAGEVDGELYREELSHCGGVFFVEQDHVPQELEEILGGSTAEAEPGLVAGTVREKVPGVKYLIHIRKYRWMCLGTQGVSLEQTAYRVQSALRDLRPALFSCMIFGKMDTMTQLRQVYDSQKYVFSQRCFEGTELCIFTDTAHPWEPAEFPEKQEMTEKFAQENMEGQLRMIDQIFRPVIQNGDYDAFIQGVTWMASELKKRGQEQRKDWQLYDEEVPELLTARQIQRWLKKKIAELSEKEEKPARFGCAVMKQAVHCIYREYANAFLSVDDIAKEAGISVNRLNDLFKKEQGETAGKFLTKVRMERARELLDEGSEKMTAIAEKTGYTSTSYFARVFRKYYGMSPQEYKIKRRER